MRRLHLLGLGLGLAVVTSPPASGQSLTAYSLLTFTKNAGGGVVVAWPAVPKATGYTLARINEDGCCGSSVNVGSTTLSLVDGLTVPGTYQYTLTARFVRATPVVVEGTYYFGILDPPPMNRRSVTVVTACTPIQTSGGHPPQTMAAGPNSPTKAYVSWAAVSGAVAYKLERSEDLTTWTDLGCLPSAQTGFSDMTRTDLPPAATIWPARSYTYKVTAYQSTGANGWNSTKAYLPGMTQPFNLTATRVGNQVTLCWGANPQPDRFVITTSYGTNIQVAGASRCRQMLGVPDGLQTFTVGSAYSAMPTNLESNPVNRPSIQVRVTP